MQSMHQVDANQMMCSEVCVLVKADVYIYDLAARMGR